MNHELLAESFITLAYPYFSFRSEDLVENIELDREDYDSMIGATLYKVEPESLVEPADAVLIKELEFHPVNGMFYIEGDYEAEDLTLKTNSSKILVRIYVNTSTGDVIIYLYDWGIELMAEDFATWIEDNQLHIRSHYEGVATQGTIYFEPPMNEDSDDNEVILRFTVFHHAKINDIPLNSYTIENFNKVELIGLIDKMYGEEMLKYKVFPQDGTISSISFYKIPEKPHFVIFILRTAD